jgi:hypothetical protein
MAIQTWFDIRHGLGVPEIHGHCGGSALMLAR